MFKSKIKGRAEEGIKDSAEKWHEYARNNGHLNKKALPSGDGPDVINLPEHQEKIQGRQESQSHRPRQEVAPVPVSQPEVRI